MCSSGYCHANCGGLCRGTCYTPKQDGESCLSSGEDEQCAGSLECARTTASDADASNYICCQGITYAGNDFCTGMADGSSCWSDTMCSSGNCFDNCGGLCRGTCFTPNLNSYFAITSLTCEAAGLDTIFDTSECLEAAQTLSKQVTYDLRNNQYPDIVSGCSFRTNGDFFLTKPGTCVLGSNSGAYESAPCTCNSSLNICLCKSVL
jgi:hypothetical protein